MYMCLFLWWFLYGVNVYEFIPIVLFIIKKCVYIKMGFLKLFYSYNAFYD